MKKRTTNSVIKMISTTAIAVIAMLNPAFCQVQAAVSGINTYAVAVPGQQVNFRLPKDIRSGDMITGTVVENRLLPYNKASSTIEGTVIEINGKQTKLSKRLISFVVPAGLTAIPFVLKNTAGQVIAHGQIPVSISNTSILSALQSSQPVSHSAQTFFPEAVAQPGQVLRVSGSFDGDAANTNVALNGQACEIIAESPRMSYVEVPKNATAGVSNLSIEEHTTKEEHKVNVAVLNLSASKTTLHKGEKATITVMVSGLEGLQENNNGLKLSLENQSPQTVSFMNENNSVIINNINTKSVSNGRYEFSTRIIAQTSGVYSISANLIQPEDGGNPCLKEYNDCISKADEVYEAQAKKCKGESRGDAKAAETCLAPFEKARDEQKAACLKTLIECTKNKKK